MSHSDHPAVALNLLGATPELLEWLHDYAKRADPDREAVPAVMATGGGVPHLCIVYTAPGNAPTAVGRVLALLWEAEEATRSSVTIDDASLFPGVSCLELVRQLEAEREALRNGAVT